MNQKTNLMHGQVDVMREVVAKLETGVNGASTTTRGRAAAATRKLSGIKAVRGSSRKMILKPSAQSADRDIPMPEPTKAGNATGAFKDFR